MPGLSRDLPIVNLHKARKTQSYQLVHIHKICKQDFALSSPSHNLINTKVVYDLFSISIHTCLSLFQVAIRAYIQRLQIFTEPDLSRKKRGKVLVRKNLPPCWIRIPGHVWIVPKGAVPAYHCQNWPDLGKFWGNSPSGGHLPADENAKCLSLSELA